MTRHITVRITRGGTVQAETEGFRGPECLAWVKPLERLLEAKVASSHYTEEFDLVAGSEHRIAAEEQPAEDRDVP